MIFLYFGIATLISIVIAYIIVRVIDLVYSKLNKEENLKSFSKYTPICCSLGLVMGISFTTLSIFSVSTEQITNTLISTDYILEECEKDKYSTGEDLYNATYITESEDGSTNENSLQYLHTRKNDSLETGIYLEEYRAIYTSPLAFGLKEPIRYNYYINIKKT